MKKAFLFSFLFISSTYAQIQGFTDSLSEKYNPTATLNDGSCFYAKTKIKPISSYILNDTLHETSGLIAYDNLLWTHNDDHDTTLYGMDSIGVIKKKVKLKNVVNQDWEALSQNDTHLFIGDFGNNSTGNRTNLKIYRIEKESFYSQNPLIDTISFSYSDQTDFSKQKSNTTNFDCEAFVVQNDSIYLFTKQWTQNKTSVYVMPNTPGKQLAQFKEMIDVEGMITDAALDLRKNTIVLCGYTTSYQNFLFLLYDYKDTHYGSGNKRRVKLELPFHQIEGITTIDGQKYFITNETTIKWPIIHTKPQLHYLDLSDLLKKQTKSH